MSAQALHLTPIKAGSALCVPADYSLLSLCILSCVLVQYIQATSLRSCNTQREDSSYNTYLRRAYRLPAQALVSDIGQVSHLVPCHKFLRFSSKPARSFLRLPSRYTYSTSTSALSRPAQLNQRGFSLPIWRFLRRRNPRHPIPTSSVPPALSTRPRIPRVNSYLSTL